MTREDIIREADAWLKMNGLVSDGQTCFRMASFAQHIAALVAAAEREAFAKYLDDCGEHEHANYIRSRGEVKP